MRTAMMQQAPELTGQDESDPLTKEFIDDIQTASEKFRDSLPFGSPKHVADSMSEFVRRIMLLRLGKGQLYLLQEESRKRIAELITDVVELDAEPRLIDLSQEPRISYCKKIIADARLECLTGQRPPTCPKIR